MSNLNPIDSQTNDLSSNPQNLNSRNVPEYRETMEFEDHDISNTPIQTQPKKGSELTDQEVEDEVQYMIDNRRMCIHNVLINKSLVFLKIQRNV